MAQHYALPRNPEPLSPRYPMLLKTQSEMSEQPIKPEEILEKVFSDKRSSQHSQMLSAQKQRASRRKSNFRKSKTRSFERVTENRNQTPKPVE
jgi:hypothetical protein